MGDLSIEHNSFTDWYTSQPETPVGTSSTATIVATNTLNETQNDNHNAQLERQNSTETRKRRVVDLRIDVNRSSRRLRPELSFNLNENVTKTKVEKHFNSSNDFTDSFSLIETIKEWIFTAAVVSVTALFALSLKKF